MSDESYSPFGKFCPCACLLAAAPPPVSAWQYTPAHPKWQAGSYLALRRSNPLCIPSTAPLLAFVLALLSSSSPFSGVLRSAPFPLPRATISASPAFQHPVRPAAPPPSRRLPRTPPFPPRALAASRRPSAPRAARPALWTASRLPLIPPAAPRIAAIPALCPRRPCGRAHVVDVLYRL
ncbi:hypothetical protein B0H13DRAFT_2429277 [Mycena leptocephala]|nr:hypothetical protein B0H13DRAFT_2429277 [Mycena leptocephala]